MVPSPLEWRPRALPIYTLSSLRRACCCVYLLQAEVPATPRKEGNLEHKLRTGIHASNTQIHKFVSHRAEAVSHASSQIIHTLRANADSAEGQASTFRAHFGIFDGACGDHCGRGAGVAMCWGISFFFGCLFCVFF
jgi:hypothetical protein